MHLRILFFIEKMFIVFDSNDCSGWEADSEANQK